MKGGRRSISLWGKISMAVLVPALALVVAVFAPAPAAAQSSGQEEEPLFAVEVGSAARSGTLDGRLDDFQEAGVDARIERREGLYRLLIGSWSNADPARRALERWRQEYPSAVLYTNPAAERLLAERARREERDDAESVRRSSGPEARQTADATADDGEARTEVQRQGQQNVAVPEQAQVAAQLAEQRRRESRDRWQAEVARLWALAGEQRWREVERGIREIEEQDPDWTPPAELLDLLAGEQQRRRAAEAVAGSRWREVLTLAQELPEEFSCRRIDLLWGLAEAQARTGDGSAAARTYRRAISSCDRRHVLTTLEKASTVLGPGILSQLEELARQRVPEADREQLVELRFSYFAAKMGSAAEAERPEDAVRWLREIESEVQQRQEAGLAEVAGWSYRNLGEAALARRWFERALEWEPDRESAAYGLALTQLEAGELEAVAQWPQRFPESQRLAELVQEGVAEEVRRSFEAESYLETVTLLQRRRLQQSLDRDQRLLLAWSWFHLGELDQARTLFAELYESSPDAESREGLIRSLQQSRDFAALADLMEEPATAEAVGEPDGEVLNAIAWGLVENGDVTRGEGFFRRALAQNPELEDAAYGLALLRLERGELDAADETLAGLEESPRLAELKGRIELQRAQQAYAGKDYSAALEHLQAAGARRELEDAERRLKAWSLFHLDRFAEAALTFQQIYHHRPDEAAARGLMLSLAQQQRWDAVAPLALQVAQAVDRRWPELPEDTLPEEEAGLLMVLAWSAHRQGDGDAAELWFRRAAELDPTLEDANYGLALSRFEADDLLAAEEIARGSLDHPPLRELLAQVLVRRAQDAYQRREHRASLALLEESRLFRPLDTTAEVLRGWNLYQLGQYEEASAALEPFYESGEASAPPISDARPSSPAVAPAPVQPPPASRPFEAPTPRSEPAPPRSEPAELPVPTERPAPPEPQRQDPLPAPEAAEEDPAALAAAVGWSLLQQGRPQAAEPWFRRALEHRPDLETAAEGLAGLLWERGDTREATALAERFPANARLEPYRIGALAERAVQAYEGQRWQESLDLLEELSRRRPLERQERLRHAWSLYRLGRFEESAQEMEELYREAPGTDEVGSVSLDASRLDATRPEARRRGRQEPAGFGTRASGQGAEGAVDTPSRQAAELPATAWRRVGEAGSPPPQISTLPQQTSGSQVPPRAEAASGDAPAAAVPSSRLEPPFVPRRTLGTRPYSPRTELSQGPSAAGVSRAGQRTSLGQLELTAPPSPEPPPEPGAGWTSDAGPLEERVQAALVLGWSAYRQRQWEAAANWFGRALHLRPDLAEAAHGLVLARLEQGNTWEAEQLARRYQGYPPMMEVLGRVLAARGDELAAAGEPAAALDKLEEAALYGALSRGQQITRAWVQYQVGRKASAATLFEQLYREQPDAQSAEGLLYSFKDLGRVPALERIAAEIPGPQAEWLQQQVATLYAQRKLFLASERARPGRFSELRGVTGPLLAAGWVFHDKTGVPGLGELRMERVPVVARYTWGDVVQLEVGVDRLTLDSGELLPGAEVGSLPASAAAFVTPPTTRLEDSYVPYLRLRREGWLAPYLELTTTPSNAVLDSTLAGRAGVVYQRPQGNWLGEVYVRPVQESILAYGGLVDPYVGDVWGRVLRRGGKIGGYRQWTRRWGSFLELGTENIDGEGVADNQRNYLALSVSATTKPRGLDFLAIGPYVFGEENDLNLERFTRGHGGYFSPEEMVETGLAAQFATTEGRPWWLTGRVSLGYHRHIKAQAPFFPLAPDGRFYPREVVTGSALAVELRGLWQLGDSFHLGGGLALNDSPRYDYTSAHVYLAWTPETRAALLSTDLLRRAATFP